MFFKTFILLNSLILRKVNSELFEIQKNIFIDEDYDKFSSPIKNISVQINILSLDKIDLESSTLKFSILYWKRWTDPRIHLKSNQTTKAYILDEDNHDKLYIPRLFVFETRRTVSKDHQPIFHSIELEWISNSTSITYYMENIEEIVCEMKLFTFPFDIQRCPFKGSSYHQSADELIIHSKTAIEDMVNYADDYDIEIIPHKSPWIGPGTF